MPREAGVLQNAIGDEFVKNGGLDYTESTLFAPSTTSSDRPTQEIHVTKNPGTITTALLSLALGLAAGVFFSAAAQDQKVYELRTYTATPGNLGNLNARFRDHTIRIFRKHGMEIVGFWVPTDPELADDTLIYVLEHESRTAADASWRAFGQDPEWSEVAAASNANGQILANVERQYMQATDYSPLQ